MTIQSPIKMMIYALRFNMILLMTVTFGSFGITQVNQSFASNIKSLAVIEGDYILAKDLFDGLTRKSDTIIGSAPLPGRDMVLNARTLLRIAIALDSSWRPQTGTEQIIIRRAATIISDTTMKEEIKYALYDRGVEGDFQIVFNEQVPAMTLPQTEAEAVQIGSFEYDPTKSLFVAELLAPSVDRPLKRQMVSGKIERIIKLPVLNKSIQGGDLIKASDINMIEIPAYKVQSDYIINEEGLIGMTSRRMMMAGEPLKQNQIMEPVLVQRGESVRISYQSGPIQLISEGKALQNGARGDLIRVTNYSSNRTIDAVIQNSGLVVVN